MQHHKHFLLVTTPPSCRQCVRLLSSSLSSLSLSSSARRLLLGVAVSLTCNFLPVFLSPALLFPSHPLLLLDIWVFVSHISRALVLSLLLPRCHIFSLVTSVPPSVPSDVLIPDLLLLWDLLSFLSLFCLLSSFIFSFVLDFYKCLLDKNVGERRVCSRLVLVSTCCSAGTATPSWLWLLLFICPDFTSLSRLNVVYRAHRTQCSCQYSVDMSRSCQWRPHQQR